MFYTVTYATHNERYFELLKQSCPDIVVLGYGEAWNGGYGKITSIVQFCETKKPNDIICFVDGFDSIILSSKKKILKKYKSLHIPLVISQKSSPSSIFSKYVQDKMYGRYKDKHLNAGLFMGTAKSIIDFWKDMKETENDQAYATQKCNKIDYVKIDDEHKVFYNYSSADTIDIKNKSLFINKHKRCIINSSNNNINSILSQLNYENLPIINYDFNYNILKNFMDEFILLLLVGSIFVYFKNITVSFLMSFVFFCTFLEYELSVKHIDSTNINKMLYLTIDFIHVSFNYLLIYLMIIIKCNLTKLLLLNSAAFIIISLFFYFKQCIITIISNKLLNKPNNLWNSSCERMTYFLNVNQPYEINSVNINRSEKWMDSNIIPMSIFAILNMNCLFKINAGSLKTRFTQ
jgi:hypothetical protein